MVYCWMFINLLMLNILYLGKKESWNDIGKRLKKELIGILIFVAIKCCLRLHGLQSYRLLYISKKQQSWNVIVERLKEDNVKDGDMTCCRNLFRSWNLKLCRVLYIKKKKWNDIGKRFIKEIIGMGILSCFVANHDWIAESYRLLYTFKKQNIWKVIIYSFVNFTQGWLRY